VFDTVGNSNLPNAFAAAAINGTVVTTGASLSLDLSPLLYKGLDFKVINMFLPLFTGQGQEQYGLDLQRLVNWIAQGKVKVLTHERVYRFEEIALAHQQAESGLSTGKIAIGNEE